MLWNYYLGSIHLQLFTSTIYQIMYLIPNIDNLIKFNKNIFCLWKNKKN